MVALHGNALRQEHLSPEKLQDGNVRAILTNHKGVSALGDTMHTRHDTGTIDPANQSSVSYNIVI